MKKKLVMAVAVMAAVFMLAGCGSLSGGKGSGASESSQTSDLLNDGNSSDKNETTDGSTTDTANASGADAGAVSAVGSVNGGTTDSSNANEGPASYGFNSNESGNAEGNTAIDYDFPGKYGDIDGDKVLSCLTIEDNGDDTYLVEMSVFRLSTFDGTAVRTGSNTLHYTDSVIVLEGDITFTTGGSATFTATKSDWEYIMVGDRFEFADKLEN